MSQDQKSQELKYDAIIILSGGIRGENSVPLWVQTRIDKAVELQNQTKYIITTSAATPHKALPLNESGQPLYDATVMANILIEQGVPKEKILLEQFSKDTIANAVFTRLLITDHLKLKKLLVITSDFHMPRSKIICDKVFNLNPNTMNYQLEFLTTENTGMPEDMLAIRTKKEQQRIEMFQTDHKDRATLQEFQKWLFTEHESYKAKGDTSKYVLTAQDSDSY
ncbi:YdcF family protein [archaeon]|jgi:hypothetical protein|nr:YdcF family protein [archaeon]MBT6698296.1 YdcF family protein [archaeon]